MSFLLVLFLLVADDAQPTNLWATHAGPRSNGLDMDDDFIPGEDGVDDLVCDGVGGAAGTNGAYLEDVDGDAVLEAQWFLVGTNPPTGWSTGVDSATCGAPMSPCLTWVQLQANIQSWVNANPSGGEVMACVGGEIIDQGIAFPFDGNAGIKTMPKGTYSINEEVDFEYASNPSMIIGIDADNDGAYPPHDTDDRAIFRTETSAAPSNFWSANNTRGCSRCGVHHIAIEDWATENKEGGKIYEQPGGSTTRTHVQFSDFSITDFHEGQCHGSGSIVFSQFSSNREYVAYEFGEILRFTAYLTRGNFGSTDDDGDGNVSVYRRFRALHATPRAGGRATNVNKYGVACDNTGGQGNTVKRTWGTIAATNAAPVAYRVEYIDNWFQSAGWTDPTGPNGATVAMGLDLCAIRDTWFHGNRIENIEGCAFVGATVEDNICDSNGAQQYAGNVYVKRNSCKITNWSSSVVNQSRFQNFISNQGTNANGREGTTSGSNGDFVMEDNEWDFTAAGTNNSRFGSLNYWAQEADGNHSQLSMTIRNNDIVGCASRGVGILMWHNAPVTESNTPDTMTFDGNNIFFPGNCSGVDEDSINVHQRLVSNFSATNNQTNLCRWQIDGSRITSETTLNALAGWSGNSCSGTQPQLENWQSGAGTIDPLSDVSGGGGGPYTLTVTVNGTGTGSVSSSPAGVSCGGDCTEDFTSGSSVTLTPSSPAGSTFVGWGGACSGNGACVVSMNAARSVTATFDTVGPGWQRRKLKFMRISLGG